MHENQKRKNLEMILSSLSNNRKLGRRQTRNRTNSFCNISYKQVLNRRLSCFNDALLNRPVDVIYKLILVLDTKNNPVIHFISQSLEKAIIFQISLLCLLSNLLQSPINFSHLLAYKICQKRFDIL